MPLPMPTREFQLLQQLGRHVPNQRNYVAAAADHHLQSHSFPAVDWEWDNCVASEASGLNGAKSTLIVNCVVVGLKMGATLVLVF